MSPATLCSTRKLLPSCCLCMFFVPSLSSNHGVGGTVVASIVAIQRKLDRPRVRFPADANSVTLTLFFPPVSTFWSFLDEKSVIDFVKSVAKCWGIHQFLPHAKHFYNSLAAFKEVLGTCHYIPQWASYAYSWLCCSLDRNDQVIRPENNPAQRPAEMLIPNPVGVRPSGLDLMKVHREAEKQSVRERLPALQIRPAGR